MVAADPKARRKALESMPLEFLKCRATGHAWDTELLWGVTVPDPSTTDGERTMRGWRTIFRRCLRSGSTVTSIYDAQLQLHDETRTYPDGYLLPAGLESGEHFRSEAWAELWERQGGR